MRRHRRILHLGIASLVLSSCALSDAPKAPTITSAEQLIARRLDDPGLQHYLKSVDAAPTAKGWDFKSLYWSALYFNPELRLAQVQIEVSKASAITAGQIPNPIITLPLTHDTTTTPSEWLFGVGFAQTIETNGKREIREAVAAKQTKSVEYQAVNKAWDVRANVLNALLALAEARETLAMSAQYTATQKRIVGEYNERLQQGQMPTAVASQAEISYQQALLQNQQARSAESDAKVLLAGAIGVPVAAIDTITIRTDTLRMGKPGQADVVAKVDVLKHHPAMLAALADYEAAQESLNLELANRIPDIEIGPGYQWDSHQGGIFTLNLTMNLPIFNNNEGPVAEANAKRMVAARQLEATQAALLNAIEQAESADRNARREWAATNGVISLQTAKIKRLHDLLHGTEASILPNLYGQADLQSALLSQLAAESKWRKARATREAATRTPLFGPVINATQITGTGAH